MIHSVEPKRQKNDKFADFFKLMPTLDFPYDFAPNPSNEKFSDYEILVNIIAVLISEIYIVEGRLSKHISVLSSALKMITSKNPTKTNKKVYSDDLQTWKGSTENALLEKKFGWQARICRKVDIIRHSCSNFRNILS
ncbi:hypothetical protein WUBG_12799 [Wuchereria bancrofti]|uniref:Uncharacterized protein n=1 Tax=Wuchereria bancrofti TaxID=6293 RepID=J9E235_WUCBA|nr:hypothetical protein WUBG_12799 [Wuchereria bancrofti]